MCPGVLVSWTPGSVWDTYPYQLHAHCSLGWEPVSFLKDTNQLCLRADSCTGTCSIDDQPCGQRSSLLNSAKYTTFLNRANHVLDYTNWNYLSALQLKHLCKKYADKCIWLRTQVRFLRILINCYLSQSSFPTVDVAMLCQAKDWMIVNAF